MDNEPLSEDEINKFAKVLRTSGVRLLGGASFYCLSQIQKLTKPENKAKYIVEIYSIYIQAMEILLMNMHVLTVPPKTSYVALSIVRP